MYKQECVAMLLAGGEGIRLGGLTEKRAKPAVSFYGNYRIIDFTLSNCTNSKINTVGVLIQYEPLSLISYIGLGSAWNLANPYGGVNILPPIPNEQGETRYSGTANAVYQNFEFIDLYDPEYVIILSGDHIYKMDYSQMLAFHKMKNSEITIATVEVPREDSSRFGILTLNEDQRVTEFEEKPSQPKGNLASMGVYIFNWSTLKQALLEDEGNFQSQHDFGKNIIPQQLKHGKKVYAYKFQGYWRDVGTIESYYHANMDSLHKDHFLNNFDSKSRIFSNEDSLSPSSFGFTAKVENSFVSKGCIVHGEVRNSILAPGVYVGKGAQIKDSILLPFAKIQTGSRLYKTIVGENAEIMNNCIVGAWESIHQDHERITVIKDYQKVSEGSIIGECMNGTWPWAI
ncbi:glucose-1-phosphate adenylyltransferase [Desulfosporosinus sp. PR]|uniref:glucose-1-phosphate adenylyltransferase n=1 Tax=Candidatus Desulfosporosinus nitrosoreducens TaxID=3401928 RepID=UPI0027F8F7C1|nr:glucose-1-phosphate adenylyltransferase [Desulfosporosinus sp. PR]MDQ7094321.1 glucose-1-phosphate adenylyltransferase [Desulfosporosinus sp. PR]